MSYARIIFGSLVLCLVSTHGSAVSVVNSNKEEYECPEIEDSMRNDCGFPGITSSECAERACCFKPTSTAGVPWCYTERFEETTSTLPTTTTVPRTTTNPVQAFTLKPIPHWIQVLMNATTGANTKKSKQPSSELPLLTREIRDELMCQNTYRLFRKVRGASKCQMNLDMRVSCIGRDFARKAGESECEACTKLNCCYDPVVKVIGSKRVPHCYKTMTMTNTTQPPTTTSTKATTTTTTDIMTASATTSGPKRYWPGIRPEYQPGNTPKVAQSTGNIGPGSSLFNGMNPSISNAFGQNTGGSPNTFQSFGSPGGISQANGNIFNILSSLRRPMNLPTTVNPAITNFLQQNTAKPMNTLSMLSLLNRPRNASTSATSSLSNILSILGQQQQASTPPPASNSLLFSNLLSGLSGQQSTGTSSNLLNTLSSLYNKPSSGNTNQKTVLNIFGSPFEEEPVTAAPLVTNKPRVSQSNSMSQIFSSYLNPSNSAGSGSALTNLLLNRLRPSTAPSSAGGGMSSLLSQLLGNSPSANLISSLLSSNNRPSAAKPTDKPVPESPTKKPKVPTSIGIPVLFEKEQRPLPPRTCYPRNCGHRATDGQITHRIVGGQWSGGIEYWPWMASFRRTFFDDDRFIHVCGATIISRRWIVTAGHCFMAYRRRGVKLVGQKEKFPSVYAIHVGKYYRDSPEPTMQVFEIESFEAHPEYDFRSLKHDIAVAKLKEPIQYTNYVQPACLPEREDILIPRQKAWVTGWGETLQVGDQNKSKLKELTLPLIANNKCRSFWPNHFHEAWICTEGAYLEDACAGDSGGPLMKRGIDARWDLIGVAIAGTRTCSTVKTDIKPGIYTKLAYYRDFIDVATGGACNEEYKFF